MSRILPDDRTTRPTRSAEIEVINIAIIGAGARGLSVLERLIAFARAQQFTAPLQIQVFDPQAFGPGCHSTDQADHLLVNTIASQITIFSDATVQGSGWPLEGPSFYEWLCDRQVTPPDPNAYYSRKCLGEYLAWGFQYLCDLAPASVQVTTIDQSVIATVPIGETSRPQWRLKTQRGERYTVDYVFLTTGHEHEAPNRDAHDRRLFPAYPLDKSTAGVKPTETVAIEGLGLSTCDVISMLTIGRGGQFFRDDAGRLSYQASGQEPQIIGFSRSGLPLSARARNEKEVREQYKPYFLTRSAVSQLQEQFGQLDFEAQILPLLLADMEFVYSKTYVQQHQGYVAANNFANGYLNATEAARSALIAAAIPVADRFDWAQLVQPIPADAKASQGEFSAWLDNYLQADLAAANAGNLSNPLKAACDVLRDVRDNLRSAIDFAGLTATSHRWLMQTFLPVMNRLAVGPPKIRLEEMLALQAAGILRLDLGPNPQWQFDPARQQFVITGQFASVTADVLIRSRIAMPTAQASRNPLLQQLLADGVAQPFRHGTYPSTGLDVSRELNLVSATNAVHPNFWVLGTPIEGPKFYTFILPRPFVNSTALVDADRVVQSLRDQICQQTVRQQLEAVPVALQLAY
jgi:uncharacterized NAD(P)/FAD-binding protein YdhS